MHKKSEAKLWIFSRDLLHSAKKRAALRPALGSHLVIPKRLLAGGAMVAYRQLTL
nr:MAG TPA: hypothetical protein [Caudoviricetes sp.]DAL43721.1 MAG TPA_asm: hypothetical protein [Caudoviricetes sp.]DAT74005.1 MAG TPA: hypothetical protein [Caudoviricetes sp.]